MSKHTPDWTLCDIGDYGDFDGECRVILGNNQSRRIAVVHTYKDNPETEANARLIAAAPEMLEALKRANAWFLGAPAIDLTNDAEGLQRQALYEYIAAVIDKAEGRE